jgi:hypothetical protein
MSQRGHRGLLLTVSSLALLSSALLACSALLSLEPPPTETALDDGGGGSDAIVPGDAGCLTRYVSASGSDQNSGCSQNAPLKTIKAAIAAYETVGASGYTIQVCGGSYAEDELHMESRGSLLGGFNCTTWTRAPDYATSTVNESKITVATPDSNHQITLIIGPVPDAGGAAADASAPELVVDGFSIVGPSGLGSALPNSYAVRFTNGATGLLSNSKILAGDATEQSIAVASLTATPEISNNVIRSGTATSVIAVNVTAGNRSPYIHGNQITAQDSTSTAAGSVSYGIIVNGSKFDLDRIEDNSVQSGDALITIGIKVNGATRGTIQRNRVQALPSKFAPGIMRAISVESGANVRITGNRAYAGGGGGGVGAMGGIVLIRMDGAEVSNNMVYGGSQKHLDQAGLAASGIALVGATGTVVESNTVFSGFSSGPTSRAYGLQVYSTSDGVRSAGTFVRNNIFAGSGIDDFGILIDNCSQGITAMRNNAFFGQSTGLALGQCGDAGTIEVRDIGDLAKVSGKPVDGNVTLRTAGTCGAIGSEGTCVPNAACNFPGVALLPDGGQPPDGGPLDGKPTCVESMLARWSEKDNGYGTLFSPTLAFDLSPDASCAVTRGGLDLSDAGITQDFYGHKRGAAPSMGASELLDAACP